jgi:hypothetical protein
MAARAHWFEDEDQAPAATHETEGADSEGVESDPDVAPAAQEAADAESSQ